MVSVTLHTVARFTPVEWTLLDACDLAGDPTEVEENLRLKHCFWWAWAAVMWMGCEVAPKALSTRFIAGMWYLFTLIMVSSYTANLAASLTAENMNTPIEDVEDLANQVETLWNVNPCGTSGGNPLWLHEGRLHK
jgi:ionotropic glutamate receptor